MGMDANGIIPAYANGGILAARRRPALETGDQRDGFRSGSQVGLVPTHPLDTHGKTPTNLREGIFSRYRKRGVLDRVQVADGRKVEELSRIRRARLTARASVCCRRLPRA